MSQTFYWVILMHVGWYAAPIIMYLFYLLGGLAHSSMNACNEGHDA